MGVTNPPTALYSHPGDVKVDYHLKCAYLSDECLARDPIGEAYEGMGSAVLRSNTCKGKGSDHIGGDGICVCQIVRGQRMNGLSRQSFGATDFSLAGCEPVVPA